MAFKNKFHSQSKGHDRKVNVREERAVPTEKQLHSFNFKDLDVIQCPPGQTVEEWQNNGMLAPLFDKLKSLSNMSLVEAQQQGLLTIYGNFPPKSDFDPPIALDGQVKWAVLKKINGQKGRVAGYVNGNTFFLVFLDKDHRFYVTEKKRT